MKKKNKKASNKKNLSIAIIIFLVPIFLWLFEPLRDDIYKLLKNKSYLTLKKKYHNVLKTFSDKTSVLAVRPLAFVPYTPKKPESEGQRKALIVGEIKIKNRRSANNIQVKFDIDDGAGRRVNSEDWDNVAKQQSLIFSMFYPDVKFVTWSPDIPNRIEDIAKNREMPFKLWLIVGWEDADKKKHQLESYSELRYDEELKLYYFDERKNQLLF